jgi:hypothetical protein
MSKLLPEVKDLLDSCRLAVLDMFDVPNDLLPVAYHGKKKLCPMDGEEHNEKMRYRNLAAVDNQFERKAKKRKPNRASSVKFDSKRNVTRATSERMAALESYREQIAAGEANEVAIVPHTPCERRQNNTEIAFVKVMVQAGIITIEDFE